MTMPDSLPGGSSTSLTLLQKLRDVGDDASWRRFHDSYVRLLHAVALRAGLGEAEAQDVVQETIIDVAAQMPGFQYDRTRGRFKNWLLTIVRRRISNHHRRQHYRHEGQQVPRAQRLDTALVATTPMVDAEFERVWAEEWERHILDTALARVKARVKPLQYQAFQLHVLKEVPVAEVCERLGVKAREVYWAKDRIKELLKEEMREIEEG